MQITGTQIISLIAIIVSLGTLLWNIISHQITRRGSISLELLVKSFCVPYGIQPFQNFIENNLHNFDQISSNTTTHGGTTYTVDNFFEEFRSSRLVLGNKILAIDGYFQGKFTNVLESLDNLEEIVTDYCSSARNNTQAHSIYEIKTAFYDPYFLSLKNLQEFAFNSNPTPFSRVTEAIKVQWITIKKFSCDKYNQIKLYVSMIS